MMSQADYGECRLALLLRGALLFSMTDDMITSANATPGLMTDKRLNL